MTHPTDNGMWIRYSFAASGRKLLYEAGLRFDGEGQLLNAGKTPEEKVQNENEAYKIQFSTEPTSYKGNATSINDVNLLDIYNSIGADTYRQLLIDAGYLTK